MATVMPARVSRPGERRTGLAGADDDGVESAHGSAHHDQQRAADGDGVFDEGGRTIVAERRGETRADGVSAERAGHRADAAGDQPAGRPIQSRAPIAAPESAPDTRRAPNCMGTVRLGVEGS